MRMHRNPTYTRLLCTQSGTSNEKSTTKLTKSITKKLKSSHAPSAADMKDLEDMLSTLKRGATYVLYFLLAAAALAGAVWKLY